jgi:hypothetical protein
MVVTVRAEFGGHSHTDNDDFFSSREPSEIRIHIAIFGRRFS